MFVEQCRWSSSTVKTRTVNDSPVAELCGYRKGKVLINAIRTALTGEWGQQFITAIVQAGVLVTPRSYRTCKPGTRGTG